MELDENPSNQGNVFGGQLGSAAVGASQSSMKFDLVVKFFNKFGETKGKDKSKLTRTFIGLLFKENRRPYFTYNILRLLLPAEDRERGNYGIKEKSISVILKEALGLTTDEFERLQHYKNPSYHTKTDGVGVGDYPTVVYTILQKYCTKDCSITVEQVNSTLDELVKKTDHKEQVATFTFFLKICTAEEIKWLIRVILKDLKLGIKADVVLKYYHPDAQDYFNLTNSLKQVCRKFEDRSISLKDELMLFQPIKPMLAGKKPLYFFDTRYKEYLLETKFDGERLQVHMSGSEIKMFSRNGKDYSHIYKELVPLLKENINADACILDGEVLVLEKGSLNMVPFGMNKQVALDHDKSVTSNMQICYKVFDTLWVRHDSEEANLMGFALKKRKHIMYKFIKEETGRLYIVRGYLVSGTEAITYRFFKSIERNYEGIILKDPESFYVPNDRSVNWIKLKGDYVEGLTDTLDLLIIGGYYGESSYRTGTDWTDKITTFLLGVITHLDTANPRGTHVIPFCKVGTGYSESSLNYLRQRLRKAWIKNDGRRPSYIVGNWKPKLDDKPDCYIDSPNNSVVLYVKAAELIKSDAFAAEKTLRFPRVVKIRYDKDWHYAMKFEYLEVMMSEKYTKGIKRRSAKNNEEVDSEVEDKYPTEKTKKRQANPSAEQHRKKTVNLEVLEWYKGAEIEQSEVVSDLFNNQYFLVLNLERYEDKPLIYRKILQNGGNIAQNPLPTTRFVIVDKLDFKFRTLAYSENSKRYVFIKPSYIEACIQEAKLLPLTPVYLTVVPRDQADYFNTRFDLYGDSYSEFLNLRELDCIIKQMEVYEPQLDKTLMSKLDKRLHTKVAYYNGLSIEDRVCLRARGYRLVTELTEYVTHIIRSKDSSDRIVSLIKQYLRGTDMHVYVKFIEDLRIELGFEL